MTAVLGHLTALDFTPANKSWQHPPPESLFTAPVVTLVPDVSVFAHRIDSMWQSLTSAGQENRRREYRAPSTLLPTTCYLDRL